jgi:multiple sugar transport system permease protein
MIASPRPSRRSKREIFWFYAFIGPWLAGFVCFTAYPIAASAYFSLTRYSAFEAPAWVGLRNYAFLLGDRLFWHSLLLTLAYTVGSVPLQLLLALGCALLLNLRVPFMRALRAIYYLPTVMPVAASSMLWLFLFLPQHGVVSWIIRTATGLDGPDWLGDPHWVLPTLILVSLWTLGSAMVVFLAGLQAIPPELYEAASLDGAGLLARARNVTLPMVSPIVLLNLILGLIGASQAFTQVYVMTQGGPDYASYLYNVYLYQNAFEFFKLGLASAQAWVMFVVILGLTTLVFRSSARWVYYGGE